MPIIRLSDATYRTVAEISSPDFDSTGIKQGDGSWLVPIEDHVMANLGKLRLPGETDDMLVSRLVRAWRDQQSN